MKLLGIHAQRSSQKTAMILERLQFTDRVPRASFWPVGNLEIIYSNIVLQMTGIYTYIVCRHFE